MYNIFRALRDEKTEPWVNLVNDIMLVLSQIIFFIPPAVLVILAIIGVAIFYKMFKRFRQNPMILQVVAIISIVIYPACMFTVPVMRLINFALAQFADTKGELITAITTPIFESAPFIAFITIFTIWLILYTLKVHNIFSRNIFLVAFIVVHIVLSVIVFIGFFLYRAAVIALNAWAGINEIMNFLFPLILFFINSVVFIVGGIVFFAPFGVLTGLSFRFRKLNLKGVILVGQAFACSVLALIIVFAFSKLWEFVLTLIQFILNKVINVSTYGDEIYKLIELALNLFSQAVEILSWFVASAIIVAETFVLLYVYGKKLGSETEFNEQTEFGKSELEQTAA